MAPSRPGLQPAPEHLGEENDSGPAEADDQDAGNTFNKPTALVIGDHTRQHNRIGSP
ncbi:MULTISPECIES: hypothetical protein [unclassified Streptomyces]|uniref:hypothetical protein n=1 Tax=unclassified Streptomyces TaxID=2593676 RepID=UPI002253D3B5|nr:MULTISPECIES: hypothetical protein [unclassified Streptomyces]MCX4524183.1 hypothetical protein [Streptomyces sp. NBC_01551]MCX4545298.1 hypothetical protein [Streptomyces sp. NBC_01565]